MCLTLEAEGRCGVLKPFPGLDQEGLVVTDCCHHLGWHHKQGKVTEVLL